MNPNPGELNRVIREQTLDLRCLNLAGFRKWLGLQMPRWESDPVFAQQVVIRDLRRAHPELRPLERAYQQATKADEAGPQFARLRQLDDELYNAGKATEGLSAAVAKLPPERRAALEAKLASFREIIRALEAERVALEAGSPEQQSFLTARGELDRFRAEIGLDREEARLAELQTARGRRTGRSGDSFEDTAADLIRQRVIPELAPDGDAHILHGVRFGAARVEFDLLVIRQPDTPTEPVEVLAVVEAKRNINDLAHGFLHRQEDLTWLTGDRGRYDPSAFRTKTFPTGHFDREVSFHSDGAMVRFGPDSFRLFRRDPSAGLFLDRLYLVTRPGWVWGVSSAATARISARIATDEDWNPGNAAYLGRLLDWAKSLAGPTETPDILRLYATSPARAGQVLFPGRPPEE